MPLTSVPLNDSRMATSGSPRRRLSYSSAASQRVARPSAASRRLSRAAPVPLPGRVSEATDEVLPGGAVLLGAGLQARAASGQPRRGPPIPAGRRGPGSVIPSQWRHTVRSWSSVRRHAERPAGGAGAVTSARRRCQDAPHAAPTSQRRRPQRPWAQRARWRGRAPAAAGVCSGRG